MGFVCKCRYWLENGELVLEWKNLFGKGLKMLFWEKIIIPLSKTSIFCVTILNNFKVQCLLM